MSLKVDKVLWDEKSKFQHVVVYETSSYGTVLVLDGCIQITDRDWTAYQEMITHVAMMAHPNPEKVLIIGGGDGGVIGEVLKHRCVKKLVLCEIDGMVVDVCKRFFPQFKGWDDPRVSVLIDDGAAYVANNKNAFDVIIVDSSDPVGPAETLWTPAFYQSLKDALTPGGIVVQQSGNVWLHLDLISKLIEHSKQRFQSVDYCYTCVPTYPSGQIGFLFSSPAAADFRTPSRKLSDSLVPGATTAYYTEHIHHAAFVLPAFAAQKLDLKPHHAHKPHAHDRDHEHKHQEHKH